MEEKNGHKAFVKEETPTQKIDYIWSSMRVIQIGSFLVKSLNVTYDGTSGFVRN